MQPIGRGGMAGSSRLSIVALVVFFVGGTLLLLLVDEKEGIRVAREEDEAFAARAGEMTAQRP